MHVKCSECGTDVEISRSWYDMAKREGRQFRCKECTRKWRKNAMKQRMDTMSENDKSIMYSRIVAKNRINYSNISKSDIEKKNGKSSKIKR